MDVDMPASAVPADDVELDVPDELGDEEEDAEDDDTY